MSTNPTINHYVLSSGHQSQRFAGSFPRYPGHDGIDHRPDTFYHLPSAQSDSLSAKATTDGAGTTKDITQCFYKIAGRRTSAAGCRSS